MGVRLVFEVVQRKPFDLHNCQDRDNRPLVLGHDGAALAMPISSPKLFFASADVKVRIRIPY
jgi:hypothetical protein